MGELRVSQKVVRNTIFNTIGRFWQLLIGLILTPYIISHIGMERYGIWALVGMLTGYFGLLDFGVKDSFTKFIAEFYAKEDYKTLNEVVNVGFVFYSLFALIVTPLGFIFLEPIIRFLKIPTGLHDETLFVFLVGIVSFSLSNVIAVFSAIQSGLQRMDVSNKIAVAMSFPRIIGIIVLLQLGYGLPGLMVSDAVVMVISGIIHFLIAFKILPTFRFNPFMFNKKVLEMLFGFGLKRWVTQIESIVTFQTDRVLISHFLNISLVAYYQLGSSIVMTAWGVLSLITSAIVPAASELYAREAREKTMQLYLRGGKYVAMISAPAMVFLFVTAHPIMVAWMGTGYKESELVIQILSLSFLVSSFSAMGTSIAVGIGRPDFQMKAGGGQAILNVILSIILIGKIGLAGVVLATLISFSLSTGYLLRMLHSHLKIPLTMFIKESALRPLVISLMLGSLTYLGNFGLSHYLPLNRSSALVILIFEAMLFFVIYFISLSASGFISEKDRALFKDILPLGSLRWTNLEPFRGISERCGTRAEDRRGVSKTGVDQ